MRVVETSGPVGCKGHEMPLAERMVQRPRHIVGQAFRPHLVINGVLAAQRGIAFEIFAHLDGAVLKFVGGTIDVFGSLPDIVVDSLNHGLAHPVGPHDPGAKPLRMVDQDMKRRPLDGNARSLEPDTQLSENIVNEALIARVVCQPVQDVAVRMRGDRIDFWRRVHILLPNSDLDRRYGTCCVPARRRQSAFTRVAACTLALSPICDTLVEGFSHFVTSMTAPIASGWSDCRVGLAPTGKRRLCTAHTRNGHRAGGRTAHRCDRIFLRRELYIKGGFWQAIAERRLAEDWRRMSPRAMAAHV